MLPPSGYFRSYNRLSTRFSGHLATEATARFCIDSSERSESEIGWSSSTKTQSSTMLIRAAATVAKIWWGDFVPFHYFFTIVLKSTEYSNFLMVGSTTLYFYGVSVVKYNLEISGFMLCDNVRATWTKWYTPIMHQYCYSRAVGLKWLGSAHRFHVLLWADQPKSEVTTKILAGSRHRISRWNCLLPLPLPCMIRSQCKVHVSCWLLSLQALESPHGNSLRCQNIVRQVPKLTLSESPESKGE